MKKFIWHQSNDYWNRQENAVKSVAADFALHILVMVVKPETHFQNVCSGKEDLLCTFHDTIHVLNMYIKKRKKNLKLVDSRKS